MSHTSLIKRNGRCSTMNPVTLKLRHCLRTLTSQRRQKLESRLAFARDPLIIIIIQLFVYLLSSHYWEFGESYAIRTFTVLSSLLWLWQAELRYYRGVMPAISAIIYLTSASCTLKLWLPSTKVLVLFELLKRSY